MGFLKDLFGPREPCALCQLGQSSWPNDRSGSADWNLRGHGLNVSLLVCVPCRTYLINSGLINANPMVALAQLVNLGAAQRPPLHAYLQHPAWRKIWLHLIDTAGLQASDEFVALELMRPLEQQFFRQAEAVSATPEASTEDAAADFGPALTAMMEEHGIPEEVIRRKYLSYALVLRASSRDSDWNDDIDGHARAIGALSDGEIEAARHDFHQAVLNRIKTALVSEGWLPPDGDDEEMEEEGSEDRTDEVPLPGLQTDREPAYEDVLAQAQHDPQGTDFTQLRHARARCGEHDPYAVSIPKLEEAESALGAGDHRAALQILAPILEREPLNPRVQELAAEALETLGRELGRATEADRHRGFARKLEESILSSGDGKSYESAFDVISVAEEYLVLEHLAFQADGSPRLEKREGGTFDVFSGHMPHGSDVKVFFKVDRFFGKLSAAAKQELSPDSPEFGALLLARAREAQSRERYQEADWLLDQFISEVERQKERNMPRETAERFIAMARSMKTRE